ncbi:MAG TPA: hypothetical protein VFZ23_11790 [Pyrinomonadaceae bacterium]
MKILISSVLIGRTDRLSVFAAVAIIMVVGLGCNNLGKNNSVANSGSGDANTVEDPNRDPNMPDDRLLKALVKETTADFAYAISTEDFSKMYPKTSTDFQQQYNPDQMKDVFKSAIANKRQLLPMLAKIVSMDPVYDPEPFMRMEQNTPILVVKGRYDLKPKPLNFNYEYVKRGGQFRLLKLIVGDESEVQ